MRNLLRAIARLLGLTTKPTEATRVLQTQTVGPVLLGRTHQAGSKPSVQATKLPPQSPVQAASSKKQKPAQRTTAASKGTSKKQKPAQTGKSQSTRGSSTPTPASKTRQHAKQAAKPKR